MRRRTQVLVVALSLALFSVFSSCAWLRHTFSLLSPPPPGVVPGSLKIEGGLVRAASVATADWLAMREQEAKAAADPENATLLECFARLESYDVYVGIQDASYIVRIIPMPQRCIRGEVQLYGGAATYQIHGLDFTILTKVFDE